MEKKPAAKKPAQTKTETTKKPAPAKAVGIVAPADVKIDLTAIPALRDEIIHLKQAPHGVEKHLVQQFIELHNCGHYEDRIPMTESDVLIREHAFKYGRADIVAYHSDGTASVIEAKDGAKGYTHVIAGIGQATLYAVQLAMTKGAVRRVRKCLLWSSTGDLILDSLVEIACEQAGVIPLPMASMAVLQATREAVTRLFEEAKNERA